MTERSAEQLDESDLANERTEMAENRTKQAGERTEWAQHRTLLANERNFSAWIRTSLAAIGVGLAVATFIDAEGVQPLTVLLGVILVLIGAGVGIMALWRYKKISGVLEEEGIQVTPKWVVFSLIGGLLVSATIMLVIILFVN
jgi:putative membrane protein